MHICRQEMCCYKGSASHTSGLAEDDETRPMQQLFCFQGTMTLLKKNEGWVELCRLVDKKNARRYDDSITYSMVSAKKALIQAGLDKKSDPDAFEKLDKTRCVSLTRQRPQAA